ncbi:hypothetical protein OFM39_30520, partial [Escherichia coli]|nr:hypothetical protein [Escherichia coli]
MVDIQGQLELQDSGGEEAGNEDGYADGPRNILEYGLGGVGHAKTIIEVLRVRVFQHLKTEL